LVQFHPQEQFPQQEQVRRPEQQLLPLGQQVRPPGQAHLLVLARRLEQVRRLGQAHHLVRQREQVRPKVHQKVRPLGQAHHLVHRKVLLLARPPGQPQQELQRVPFQQLRLRLWQPQQLKHLQWIQLQYPDLR
tara:strand:- start:120 stop:518 length:399 start_codon:yes stop_codon:yes gene_type:complete